MGGTIRATKAELAGKLEAALGELAGARELIATIARAMEMPLSGDHHGELFARRSRMQAVRIWIEGLHLGDELPPVARDYQRVTGLLIDEIERPLVEYKLGTAAFDGDPLLNPDLFQPTPEGDAARAALDVPDEVGS